MIANFNSDIGDVGTTVRAGVACRSKSYKSSSRVARALSCSRSFVVVV